MAARIGQPLRRAGVGALAVDHAILPGQLHHLGGNPVSGSAQSLPIPPRGFGLSVRGVIGPACDEVH
jgi:hypothetical protein